MVFSSSIFLYGFLPILLIAYFNPTIKNRKFKNWVLLLASLVFYFYGEPLFIFIMLFSIFINWRLGLKIEQNSNKKKKLTIIATTFNILILLVFKYTNFITENISILTGNKNIVTNIALPIGISFFTFQMMSYIFDISMGKAKAQKKYSNVMLYITMFPQLIAGPIVRYDVVANEIEERNETWDEFAQGFCRFLKGLAKKVLISNNVALLADTVFSYAPSEMSVLTAWLGAIAYTIQILFDFSGYSDMAIGLGRIFGFHFLENFDYPYKSKSITEFWRRWHISLGSWFRDYVYIPLGGSKVKTKKRLVFNLFVVWFLTGLWHGANWTFIIWGLMYFILLAIEKLTEYAKKENKSWFAHIYTMFFVIIGWVIFRAENLNYAIQYIKAMFYGNFMDNTFVSLLTQYSIFLIIGIILSIFTPIKIKKLEKYKTINTITSVIIWLAIFIITMSYVVRGGYDPFIYFNF